MKRAHVYNLASFLFGIVLTTAVFLVVDREAVTKTGGVIGESINTFGIQVADTFTNDDGPAPEVPDASTLTPIPLSGLSLTAEQIAVIEGLGIDPATYVITPAMQQCAYGAIGGERVKAIIGGEAPSAVETTQLLPCL